MCINIADAIIYNANALFKNNFNGAESFIVKLYHNVGQV